VKQCPACAERFGGDAWLCPACGWAPAWRDGGPCFAPQLADAAAGFKPEYFAELARLEACNFWFRARNRLIVQALRRHFPQARSLLEIGCGTGFVLAGIAAALPQLRLCGSEQLSAGLPFARRRLPGADLFQMDARAIPFAAEFDVVGAFDVLEHIEEDELVLAQIFKALRPGGGVLLSVPQHGWLWSRADDHACHVRRYGAAELRRKVEAAGLRVRLATSFVAWLLPLLALSRWRNRRRAGGDFDPLAELRLGGAANAVLEKILDLERASIALGVRYPAGGSLLLVAEKPL
jgi:SAM-dependent methyltransferase